MDRVTLRCFGALGIAGATGIAPPRGRKARALLAYLAACGEGGASRDRLAGLLWGTRGPDQARASVRQALTELRGAIGEDRVLADRLTVRLAPGAVETDLAQLTAALRAGDLTATAATLAAIEGELFADLDGIETEFDHWLQAQRAGAAERIVGDALRLIETAACPPATGQAIATALETLDPGNEMVARAGMRFDFLAGDQAAARRRFRRLTTALANDCDAEPAAETQAALNAGLHAPAALPIASDEAPSTPPIVIVAPFDVLGDDPQTQMMARICADDVLTVLARFRDIAVSAPGEEADPAVLAQAIAVYVLEGSVRSQEGMLRANLRLRDRRSGRMLWTHQAQIEPGSVAHDIDGIVARIVGAIEPTIARDVGHALPAAADAPVALYLRARALVAAAASYAEARAAADLLERALAATPRDAQALLLLARIYNTDYLQTIAGHDVAALRERALDLAQRAAALDPMNSRARIVLGWCMVRAHEPDAARQNFRAALLLNAYNADCLNAAGFGLVHLGDHDEAERLLSRAIELNPVPHGDYFADLATLLMLRGEHREAERHFAMQGAASFHYLGLRVANGGWLNDGGSDLTAALRQRFMRMWTGAAIPTDTDLVGSLETCLPFARASDRTRLSEGLRRAGLG
ncbi:trifolitoxin synthesis, TfuA [Sphingomonas sp. 1P06PA]|uniref:trifolitoxin synthesis, TfuA n=1 Tax=Sphingomonas sp. 1P06PA TaxID=554121 RepID=UPI0039A63E10